jgi:hypothetical protein
METASGTKKSAELYKSFQYLKRFFFLKNKNRGMLNVRSGWGQEAASRGWRGALG